jgi:hypothetical protein
MAYPDQNKLNFMSGRPIPQMPTMPTKENPWAKRKRAMLMTRMEDSGKPMGGLFSPMSYSPMSGQRAAAIASRDLGTEYEQELPNFTAQDAGEYAMQRAAPDFIKSRLATEEFGRTFPREQEANNMTRFGDTMGFAREKMGQENTQFGQSLEANKYAIEQQTNLGIQQIMSNESIRYEDRLAQADALKQQNEIEKQKLDLAGKEAAYGYVGNEAIDPAIRGMRWQEMNLPSNGPVQTQPQPAVPQQQTLTPSLDAMDGQTGYPSTRPFFLPSSGMNTFQMDRDNRALTSVMAQYGLDKYLDPVMVDNLFGSDSGKPNKDTTMAMDILARNIQMAMERTKGNPAIQQMVRARLQESLLPKIERFDDSFTYGMSNPITTGSDWIFAGGRGRKGQQAVRRIKQLLQ